MAAVCVTTRNRAHLLPRLIGALESQNFCPESFEVVVADDGSTDSTPAVLESLRRNSSLRMSIVRNPSPRGPGGGRNLAWRAARAPLIVFTDDDCAPLPGWLGAHVAALGRADISQGPVLPDPAQGSAAGPFARVVGVGEENGLYETCNISYRREWLERLGGFDPAFRRSGEDADLAWRAKDSGASTVFTSEAVVYHDVQPSSWSRALRDTARWTGVVELVDRHPHLRRRFGTAPTWREAHRPAVVAAAGLACAAWGACARRPAPVLAGIMATFPYLFHRLRVAPLSTSRRRRLQLLVPVFGLDLAEMAVIRASQVGLRIRVLLARGQQTAHGVGGP